MSAVHKQKLGAHRRKSGALPRLWEACTLQAFYAEPRLVRYFVIDELGSELALATEAVGGVAEGKGGWGRVA